MLPGNDDIKIANVLLSAFSQQILHFNQCLIIGSVQNFSKRNFVFNMETQEVEILLILDLLN